MTAGRPKVSVILPTYNRATFLEDAFRAIAKQEYPSLEVVLVDDGSTDGTAALVDALRAIVAPAPVTYVPQENQGAYGARNTGLERAAGDLLAFYDSDDLWWPHHLGRCAGALDANPDVDWVYGASEIVDMTSGRLVDPHCFYLDGRPKPFMRLATEERGDLRVIVDPGVTEWSILEGLYCGLQNSVFRRSVIDRTGYFDTRFRNEAEDQMHAIRAAAAGVRFAYFTDVHLTYRIHAQNSSGPSSPTSLAKHVQLYSALIRGFEDLPNHVALSPAGRRALRRRLAREYFWHLGYQGYWRFGADREALAAMRRGVALWPRDPRTIKTLAVTWLKVGLGLGHRRRSPGAPPSAPPEP